MIDWLICKMDCTYVSFTASLLQLLKNMLIALIYDIFTKIFSLYLFFLVCLHSELTIKSKLWPAVVLGSLGRFHGFYPFVRACVTRLWFHIDISLFRWHSRVHSLIIQSTHVHTHVCVRVNRVLFLGLHDSNFQCYELVNIISFVTLWVVFCS